VRLPFVLFDITLVPGLGFACARAIWVSLIWRALIGDDAFGLVAVGAPEIVLD